MAALRHQRIRLLDEARARPARHATRRRAARCPPVHDLRPALESMCTPWASRRCCSTSRTIPTNCATSAAIRPIRPSATASRPRSATGACGCRSGPRSSDSQNPRHARQSAPARHFDRRLGRNGYSRGNCGAGIRARQPRRQNKIGRNKGRLPGEETVHARPSRPASGRDPPLAPLRFLPLPRHRSAINRSASSSPMRPAAPATAPQG